MLIDGDDLELLDEDVCRELLAGARVGRVGVSIGALPVILPVSCVVVDGDIVFATAPGTKLRAAVRNAVIAFQIDDIDTDARRGWSVLAVGACREVTDPDDVERLREKVEPFVGGLAHIVRMTPELVTGRRIAPHVQAAAAD